MPRRLLFVTDVKPLPLDQGMRVRVWNLLAGCARGFSVTLVAPPPDDPGQRAPIECVCERVVWLGEQPVSGVAPRLATWWAGMLAAPGIRLPRNVRSYRRFAAALRGLELDAYELVWAERPHIARLFQDVRTRTIVDLDDVEHRRMRQAARFQRPQERSWAVDMLPLPPLPLDGAHVVAGLPRHRSVLGRGPALSRGQGMPQRGGGAKRDQRDGHHSDPARPARAAPRARCGSPSWGTLRTHPISTESSSSRGRSFR